MFGSISLKIGVFNSLFTQNLKGRGKMKVAILEDDLKTANLIKGYLEQYFNERLKPLELAVFDNAFDLTENYSADYDVLFLDIELPHMSGMEAAKAIRALDTKVIIVFVTNLARYAVEGYAVNAFDFILKPVNYGGFKIKLDRILRECEHKSEEKYINVNVKTAFVRINLSSLLYVEVIRHNLVYHTADDKITAYGTMKTLSEELEPHYFVMCNSCYLVNLAFVKKADNKDVYLKNGEVLAISQSKRKNFRLAVARYFGGTI